MSSHCLLASLASDEKLSVNLIEETFYVISCFSLAAINIPSVCDFQQSHYDVSRVDLRSSLNFLDV